MSDQNDERSTLPYSRRTVMGALAATGLGALGSGAASAGGDDEYHDDDEDTDDYDDDYDDVPDDGTLMAALSDEMDVETDAAGCTHFESTNGQLQFHLLLERIDNVTQAHIHEGSRGEEGPVVADLVIYNDELDGTGDGETQSADPDSPIFESGSVDDADLVENILADPSAYYVNVHTEQYPDGEIRGQIRGRDLDDDEDDMVEVDGDEDDDMVEVDGDENNDW